MNKNKDSWTSELFEYRVRVEYDTDSRNPADEFEFYSEEEVEFWKNGEVYGFIIERRPINSDDSWSYVDSCWGFYGEIYEGAYDPQYYIDQDEKDMVQAVAMALENV